MEYCDILQPIL
jgi:hypothetical protein